MPVAAEAAAAAPGAPRKAAAGERGGSARPSSPREGRPRPAPRDGASVRRRGGRGGGGTGPPQHCPEDAFADHGVRHWARHRSGLAANMSEDEINGMCGSAVSRDASEACEETRNARRRDEIELHELRGRLARRNALLDAIRKAYHRDVLSVKEALLAAEGAESARGAALAAVPSVDLRETFRLFAPHECELRVRPCGKCGGRLEVIHRESARLVRFKRAIGSLEDKERELRVEVVEAKVRAREDRDRMVEARERSEEERQVLLEQILSLKHQVADRNVLETEVIRLRFEKKNLEAVAKRQEPILAEHQQLLVEIEEVKEDRKQWKAQFYAQEEHNRQLENERAALGQELKLLQQENEQLQQRLAKAGERCQKSDDRCSTLTQDLSKSKAGTKEIEGCLQKAEHAMDELETDFRQEEQQMRGRIRSLESEGSDFRATIKELEDEARRNLEDIAYYQKKTVATLEGARGRGLLASVPREREAMFDSIDELVAETKTLRHKTGILFQLLFSFTRAIYEACLAQEVLLADNGGELHRNARGLRTAAGPANAVARSVLEHLERGDESAAIAWTAVLADDTDQRHVLGNLQNRMQMGQFSLEKAFQDVHAAREAAMLSCQEKHRAQLEERRARIWELEQMLTEAIAVNRTYEEKMLKIRDKHDAVEPKIDALRRLLRKARRESLDERETLSWLKAEYETLRAAARRLSEEARAAREQIRAQRDRLAAQRGDIQNRNVAIEQLEQLLAKITQKYAEDARRRIKVTREAAAQAVPVVAEASSHADFLSAPLRGGVSADSAPLKQQKALVPGHVFHITDLNVGPFPGGGARGDGAREKAYRRVIDQL